MASKDTYEFKAEIQQLLNILVHSLYTNKDIFLRELVSNASDALDKYRHATGHTAQAEEDGPDLEIRIHADKEAKKLFIEDTGVGMTREELVENIGTIAHSGSAAFMKELTEAKEKDENAVADLIGRFGVGFYSVYMVADEVVLTTRSHQGGPALSWTSDGKGAYVIDELADADAANAPERGTHIEIRLNPDLADQFTDPETLKRIIKTHSNFVRYPIYVDDERVNTVPALWREPKFQIKPEQYKEFYTFLTYDQAEPIAVVHQAVDAPVQFNALVFIPPTGNGFLPLERDNWGLDLYVRRVLIQRQNKDLLPEYLSFIKGVVDTEDLPLNISRETLQDNLLLGKIRSTLVKHVLGELEKMAEKDEEKYFQFWDAHSEIFKAGYQDFANRERFAKLVRFNSSTHDDHLQLTGLDGYVERAKEGQKEIYYLYGPSREACKLSPHAEIFRKKGIEVLYLYEPIDEFIMDSIREYKEFTLVSAEHADAATLEQFDDAEDAPKAEKLNPEQEAALPGVLGRIKDALGDRVTDVRASKRLSDSPVCLVNPDGQVTSSMDKIMRVMSKDTSVPQKALEVNPDHPLLRNMIEIYKKDRKDPFIEQAAEQLYESALLLEGYLNDPHALVGRIQNLLADASGWYVQTKEKVEE
ncbi:molecular chaperone HtpG [Paucidesulfovibrio gracilis DSM 16080]|uniref:Chaperone protein HtpG n=1 Tax=Paucidesulfovibrio gracilis DSM 16080 TaxID=1121449 RepID=A0A1T4YAG8_9BACT|nr:molecular chaperone HtpG [Paucidesulfovibrio gracilis]SKA98265.1 molecular chaperone HtpG [Paucidesulfovibrio gracilis DSM 16080]